MFFFIAYRSELDPSKEYPYVIIYL